MVNTSHRVLSMLGEDFQRALYVAEYREAFYLYAQKGSVENGAHLKYIMRCIGYSPTVEESNLYFKKKNGKVDFARFLDILHEHSQGENPFKEVMLAFRSHDRNRTGTLPARELRSLLMGMGEQLTPQEVERIFKEANVSANGEVKYDDLVKVIMAPLPDYY